MNHNRPQNRIHIAALLYVASPAFPLHFGVALLDGVVRWGVAVWLLTHREGE